MADRPVRGRPVTHLKMERLEDRTTPDATFADGRVLLGLTPGVEQSTLAFVNNSGLVTGYRHLGFGVYKADLRPGVSVSQAVSAFNGRNGIRYAEPDYIEQKVLLPNDPHFVNGNLWGQHNTGQNGGTPDADIDAPEGWDFSPGTGQHIIAVMDDGFDWAHEDLIGNAWTNPNEIPGNGIDDDGNGVIDDIHGADFVAADGDPTPDPGDEHGTHVGGTMGAVGNNGIGVSGTSLKARVMGIRAGDAAGIYISAQIEGFAYAIAEGVSVINGSFGAINPNPSQARAAAIQAATAAGIICVFAAGNDTNDNDTLPHYPSNYAQTNSRVIAVAATDRNDQLAGFSSWGATSVTIGAPGVDIWSTLPNNRYGPNNGTSMASPLVAGALGAFWDANPDFTPDEVVEALRRSVDPIPSLAGLVSTNGRINLANLMSEGKMPQYATGAGPGGGPAVNVYRGTSGRPVASFFAYDAGFTGGVRVATADVNGDGNTDIIVVPGKGGGPNVRVFDGKTFQIVYDFHAFEPEFTGGLFVASRDMDNDGWAEIVVAADKGGGPRVTVFKPNPLNGGAIETLANFFAYDVGFSGGVRIAIGDLDGDGKGDLITAPGLGGGPNVRGFSGASLALGSVVMTHDALAGNIDNRNGLFVAADDLTGDGIAEVIVGSGAGTPVVRVYNGLTFDLYRQFSAAGGPIPGLVLDQDTNLDGTLVNPGFPFNLIPPARPANQLPVISGNETPLSQNGYQYGIRVATHDVNRDGIADIVLGAGPTDQPKVALMNGATFAEMRNFQAYANFFYGGVFVGGAGAEPVTAS